MSESITPDTNPGDENWADGLFPLAGTDDVVYALAVDANGHLFAGGEFKIAGSRSVNDIAQWDGVTWSPVGGGLDGYVHALVVDGYGHVYTGGEFVTAGGISVNHIAEWDGTAWLPLGNGLNGNVYALTVDAAGHVYAGGDFTVAGSVGANGIAKWDGTRWSAFGRGADDTVRALAVDTAGSVYAGGEFTAAGGVSANHIAKWDGTSWSSLSNGMDYGVYALAVDAAGNLYAGGYFSAAGGVSVDYVAQWNGSTWSPLGSGMNAGIRALVVDAAGNLYAGGAFTTAGGIDARHIARWDGSTWSALGGGMIGCTGTWRCVGALALDAAGHLYAGGDFTMIDRVSAFRVARWDSAAWSALGDGMNDTVLVLASDRAGRLYAGGEFTRAGSSSARHIAVWDGITWSPLSSGMGGGLEPWVGALAFDAAGNLYAGGRFTTAGGVSANYVARWDGSTWSALGSGVSGPVRALVFDAAGNLYAGGEFTTAGGVSANYVARWDGSTWSPLGSGLSGGNYAYVRALAVDTAGNLYAGGRFYSAGGVSVRHIAKWDGGTWSALGSGIAGCDAIYDWCKVDALAIDPAGNLYAGGYFRTAGGASANHIARWTGSAWSALGSGMGACVYYDCVYALALDAAGNLYAGGEFTTAVGAGANRIAKWDGMIWSPVGSGVSGSARALAADATGNLYVGGDFMTAGNHASAYVARWTAADGVRGVTTGSYTFYASNLPVTVTVTTPGTLDRLAVQRFNRSHPQASAGLDTGYYWEITGRTATGSPASGYVVDLTLPTIFTPTAGDQVCRYAAGAWDCAAGAHTANSITRTGITELSDWAIAHYRNTWYLPLVPRGR